MPDITDQDRRILQYLQQDGKISLQELADRVGMSSSPAWRRVRKMEQEQVIEKYVAVLNPKALGLNAMAYVHVSLMEHTEATIKKFDDFVQRQDQVVDCASITGESDYVLKVVARDPEDLEHFLMQKLLGLGIVRASTTNFVLRQKKHSTSLPL